eukprot:2157627-Amphidinium_carterae.2
MPLQGRQGFVSPDLADPVQGVGDCGLAISMSGEQGRAYWWTWGGMSVQGVKCSCSSQIQKVRAGSCWATPASTSWKDQMALSEESKTIMLIPRNIEVATTVTATSEAGASEASKDASSWKTLAAS